jgi:hypothetical protein
MLRWYASCCRTPVGNCMPTSKVALVGLVDTCLHTDERGLDDAFGPVQAVLNGKSAQGNPKPKDSGLLLAILRVLGTITTARINGSYRNTPFFSADGKPVVRPKVLSAAELETVRAAVRR